MDDFLPSDLFSLCITSFFIGAAGTFGCLFLFTLYRFLQKMFRGR